MGRTLLFATCVILPTGFIGDKIGYNFVVAFHLVSAGITATAFDWTPRYHEYYRIPTITTINTTQEIIEFTWPLDCTSTNVTIEDCQNAEILYDDVFWGNMTSYVSCHNISIPTPDDTIIPDFQCNINAVSCVLRCIFYVSYRF